MVKIPLKPCVSVLWAPQKNLFLGPRGGKIRQKKIRPYPQSDAAHGAARSGVAAGGRRSTGATFRNVIVTCYYS